MDMPDSVAVRRNEAERSNALMKSRAAKEALSWFWVILAFLLIEGTLVQARVIPSGSMERTVLIGDHLIVSRIGYDAGVPFTPWHEPLWREPKRQQRHSVRRWRRLFDKGGSNLSRPRHGC